MHRPRHWVASALVAVGLAGCGAVGTEYGQVTQGPAHLEPIKGSDLNRVVLTEMGAHKLGVRTAPVTAQEADDATSPSLRIPLAALVYGRDGSTWVYVVDRPLSYERRAVSLQKVDGDTAVLESGPPAGTQVVIVGGQELLGTELGVAGE